MYPLFQPNEADDTFSIIDPAQQFDEGSGNFAKCANAAFLIAMTGNRHKRYNPAKVFLDRMKKVPEWKEVIDFYFTGIKKIREEIESACRQDPDFANSLTDLHTWVSNPRNLMNAEETIEKIWSVFFPEAVGLRGKPQEFSEALRKKRTIAITRLNPDPIFNPSQQLLFTSNVLLTLPTVSKSLKALPLSNDLKNKIDHVMREEQDYWFDHPIQIGVKPENNEVLYGLRGLEDAFIFERSRNNAKVSPRLRCVLSVSVTHKGLHSVAKQYLKETIAQAGGFSDLEVYAFSESDTQDIVRNILVPAAKYYLEFEHPEELLSVFGVDGEYGRHYSFLKAIAALWNVLIDNKIKATFKIDLDQVFPQEVLVEQTGASAFEHFRSPLWGAFGKDASGQIMDLGMIAGSLVNERDIDTSLFTPDVRFPKRALAPDEYIFFSQLPQAISTKAEMMTQYHTDFLDGNRNCIQRIHITGGTNGILVNRLFQYRPFTPSFIGRAEDQAYIFSVLPRPGKRLTYVHKDGLIMRHDKEAFAQEAIQSASIGKMVGDYVRILYFSAYARLLTRDLPTIKNILDPFTGCFISKIPVTVVYLRFALKAASLFASGKDNDGIEFVMDGAKRLKTTLDFVEDEDGMLKRQYEKERMGWNVYYDTLTEIENALKNQDHFAMALQKTARKIISECAI